jgi:hypothetical protein
MLNSGSKSVFRDLANSVYRVFGEKTFGLGDLRRRVFRENPALAESFRTAGMAQGMLMGMPQNMRFSLRFVPPPQPEKACKPSGEQAVDCFKPENPRPRGAAVKQIAANTLSVDDELLQNIMWSALLVSGGGRIQPSFVLGSLRCAYERFEVPSDAARATMGDVQRALKQFVAEAKLMRHAPGVPSSEPSYSWVLGQIESEWMKDLAAIQVPTNSHPGCVWIARQPVVVGSFTTQYLRSQARKDLAEKSNDCPFNKVVMVDFLVEHLLESGAIEKTRRSKIYQWVFKPQPPL